MEPCAVIASSTSTISTDDIIKGILDVPQLPEPLEEKIEGIKRYPWHISTKYYEADIELCSLNQKTIGTKDFADSVNGLILCFDCHSDDGLSIATQWLTFTKEFEPEIKMLLCDYSSKSDDNVQIKKLDAQKWCIENGFELIILNESAEETNEDLEDDFPESVGMTRVIQGLQAHLWPNLKMKEKDTAPTSSPNVAAASSQNGTDPDPPTAKEILDCLNMKQDMIDSLLGEPETPQNDPESSNEDMFEKLFQNLSDFKSKADKMNEQDRKAYAEKMTIAFWKSIGGNDSEIEDLSD